MLLSERAGISLVHVPYRGGGPAMNDAIAGHVDLMIGSAALVTPLRLAGPEEEARFLSEQMKLWGPVVREHGIKGD